MPCGEAVFRFSSEHAGTTELGRLLELLGERELGRNELLAFFASMRAFVRHITPGIPALASRLSDELMPVAPHSAHAIAAHVLGASFDEYGLNGTKPHWELLYDFARYFKLEESEIDNPEHAVLAANELGNQMFVWYRRAPIPYALGVHTASEVTGNGEAKGLYRAFLTPPKYGLTADSPAFLYIAAHNSVEDNHSNDTLTCLNKYLGLMPESYEQILAGARDYMTLYQRMFAQLNHRLRETS